jgi:DNA-binding NarL/FixJ family response regulator
VRPRAKPITILIADPHRLVRDALKLSIAGMLGEVHFIDASDGDSLMRMSARTPPVRLALVDVKMPGMHGMQRLLELARIHPALPVVIVSSLSVPTVTRHIMAIGTVHAFVHKSAGIGSLRRAIEAALQGRKLAFERAPVETEKAAVTLTPRQAEICDLLRLGMSNKMIAGSLGISAGTVKNHITEIFKVLNATNRTQVAQLGHDVE